MSYLLDTQVFLWMQSTPDRIGARTRLLIDDAVTSLVLSAASSWEIAIKHSLGKLALPEPPDVYVPTRMSSSAVAALPIEHAHALGVAALEQHHRDPFDRILVAQAKLEGLTLITADPVFDQYPVDVIDARR
jgi:PIN domain nuclease of toxin-antitoxin system